MRFLQSILKAWQSGLSSDIAHSTDTGEDILGGLYSQFSSYRENVLKIQSPWLHWPEWEYDYTVNGITWRLDFPARGMSVVFPSIHQGLLSAGPTKGPASHGIVSFALIRLQCPDFMRRSCAHHFRNRIQSTSVNPHLVLPWLGSYDRHEDLLVRSEEDQDRDRPTPPPC